jgi:hypothetical protein
MDEEEEDLPHLDPEQALAAIGKKLEAAPRAESRARCEEHRLSYDPKTATGCPLCLQQAAHEKALLRKGLLAGGVLLGVALLWSLVGSLGSDEPKRQKPPVEVEAEEVPDPESEPEPEVLALTEEATPEAEEATPQAEEATPQAEEATPRVEEALPQVEEALPQAEEATPQAGVPAPADPEAVAALRKVVAEAAALIQTAREEIEVFGIVSEGGGEAWDEEQAKAWLKSWEERLAAIRGTLPAQPGADADMNLILARQELENALREMGQLAGADAGVPTRAQIQSRLEEAARTLKGAKESLDQIR